MSIGAFFIGQQRAAYAVASTVTPALSPGPLRSRLRRTQWILAHAADAAVRGDEWEASQSCQHLTQALCIEEQH